jgi:hypothetical protein
MTLRSRGAVGEEQITHSVLAKLRRPFAICSSPTAGVYTLDFLRKEIKVAVWRSELSWLFRLCVADGHRTPDAARRFPDVPCLEAMTDPNKTYH